MLRSATHLQSAEIALRKAAQTEAIEDLDAAAAADPLAAEPWRQLADVDVPAVAATQPSEETLQRFTLHDDRLGAGARAAALWLAAGDRYLEVFAATSRAADRAAKRDQATGGLSPGGRTLSQQRLVPRQARLGLARDRRSAGFRREADTALRLDGLNPHAEKKLPPEVRKQLSAGPK